MESKREEFRKYLEKGGALQALNYALSRLYEMQEKPNDPLAYIAERLQQCLESGKLEEAKEVTPSKPNGAPTSLAGGVAVKLIEDGTYEPSLLNGRDDTIEDDGTMSRL
ncbi:uncharacterized protein LOC111267101 [Varroa jacobsoni]|uniref:Uncharacterized protein n=1 Tax=Varroa destructor TaxID=109461 RepID=A0A7M7K063_VARDE|nr:uncharacterized protein LOC111247206 [Varroa destructor]XP_022653602.1 uncharacterized protein LOC111247206 [Varroa destructor]XP_022653603.1 uncharacterized protein LOC111247206 [Varroa destructor]XP_022653604.1 uncharacterized protein LOC111247206 [Varroa destructor]XP_022700836.1 uncharacterized protein LOC111267101 [Varroa jacobsoni]